MLSFVNSKLMNRYDFKVLFKLVINSYGLIFSLHEYHLTSYNFV